MFQVRESVRLTEEQQLFQDNDLLEVLDISQADYREMIEDNTVSAAAFEQHLNW